MTTSERPTMRELLARDYDWTPRQRDVLDRIAQGKSNQQIADELGISLDGAKWHMREVLGKLGVDTREEAAEYWRRRNGIPSRLRGVFRGLAGWGLPKVAVGVTAVAALGAGALFVLSPGGDGEKPAAAEEPQAPTVVIAPPTVIVGGASGRVEYFDNPEAARQRASEWWTVEVPPIHDPAGRLMITGYSVDEPRTLPGGTTFVRPSAHMTFVTPGGDKVTAIYYPTPMPHESLKFAVVRADATGTYLRLDDDRLRRDDVALWWLQSDRISLELRTQTGVLDDDEAIAILATAVQ